MTKGTPNSLCVIRIVILRSESKTSLHMLNACFNCYINGMDFAIISINTDSKAQEGLRTTPSYHHTYFDRILSIYDQTNYLTAMKAVIMMLYIA